MDQLLTGKLEFISSICGTSCGYSQLCLLDDKPEVFLEEQAVEGLISPRSASGMEKHSSPNHWSW